MYILGLGLNILKLEEPKNILEKNPIFMTVALCHCWLLSSNKLNRFSYSQAEILLIRGVFSDMCVTKSEKFFFFLDST